jgi:hypothetical protein
LRKLHRLASPFCSCRPATSFDLVRRCVTYPNFDCIAGSDEPIRERIPFDHNGPRLTTTGMAVDVRMTGRTTPCVQRSGRTRANGLRCTRGGLGRDLACSRHTGGITATSNHDPGSCVASHPCWLLRSAGGSGRAVRWKEPVSEVPPGVRPASLWQGMVRARGLAGAPEARLRPSVDHPFDPATHGSNSKSGCSAGSVAHSPPGGADTRLW